MASFDPTKPSTPISFPISELADLESGAYYRSFHFPFNKAFVPLPESAASGMPDRRRILVCHDMMGGYVDDKWVQGGDNADAYAIWHWYLMDVFVYFSHNLVTIPPPCWTNAGHTHGVKVLGTFIVEWEKGAEICKTLLATEGSARMYAEKLAELASALGFDGWLINIEVDYLDKKQIVNLKEFVGHLTQVIHKAVRGSLIIWYDSVTIDGWRDYQNQLNEKNKPFFDLCDGIYVNYFWRANGVKISASFAGSRRHDVYMGIDVWGRGTYGGGGWDTNVALDLLREDDISAAIFAPGWVYEHLPKADFQSNQYRWWGLVKKSWGILQNYPKVLPFYSNFDQGHGLHFSIRGSQVAEGPWNDISSQGFQPLLEEPRPFFDGLVDLKVDMQVFIKMDSKNSGLQVTYKECWHMMRAPVAKSNTSRNPGHLFWGCPFWKTSNCHYFWWLPEDASRVYMKLLGLGVEIVDMADSLELLDNQCDMITTLVEENKMLKTRQEEIRSQQVENRRLRLRVEAMVKECQKTAVVCLVFDILVGFILGRM